MSDLERLVENIISELKAARASISEAWSIVSAFSDNADKLLKEKDEKIESITLQAKINYRNADMVARGIVDSFRFGGAPFDWDRLRKQIAAKLRYHESAATATTATATATATAASEERYLCHRSHRLQSRVLSDYGVGDRARQADAQKHEHATTPRRQGRARGRAY